MITVPIRYDVDLSSVRTNQLRVRMTLESPQDGPLDVALPFMSPGSPVNSRNHPAKLSHLEVTDASGGKLPYDKLPEGGWRLSHASGPLHIDYTLLADDFASSHNQLSDEHAYLNGAAAYMFLQGHDKDMQATVQLHNFPKPTWDSISTLPSVAGPPHTYYAVNFQELADSNIEVGSFDKACGKVDRTYLTVIKHGNSPFKRLDTNEVSAQQNLDDFKRIFRAFSAEYGAFPAQRYNVSPPLPDGVDDCNRYTIIKHYVNNDAGLATGFEHYHGHELVFSHALEEGIHRIYENDAREYENNTMAHELGHKLLGKYVQHDGIDSSDFTHEHPSDGLWLTEGVTEWLGMTTQLRAGLIRPDQYLKRLENNINRYETDYQVDPTNGRDDSLEAQHGDSEYYTKGALMGAVLDLEILHLSGGQKSFKDVLLGLKDEFGGSGKFHKLDDIKRIAKNVVADYPGGAARMDSVFHDYLEDRKPIDFNQFFAHAGLQVTARTNDWPWEALQFCNATLLSDARGNLALGVSPQGPPAPDPKAPPPFRTQLPTAGVTLGWDDGVHLKLAAVNPTGAGFAAGLGEFSGQTVLGLGLTVRNTQDGSTRQVELPVTREGMVCSSGTKEDETVEAMTFTFDKTRLFDGTTQPLTVAVPLQPATRYAIEPLPQPSPDALKLRDIWLRQLALD